MSDEVRIPEGAPHYAAYVAFRGRAGADRLPDADRAAAAAEAQAALDAVDGLTVRGSYCTVGFRAESDLMLWLLGDTADTLQRAIIAFRATRLGRSLDLWWSSIGVHREAEFAKSHIPAFLAGEEPRPYLCVYPFVRSYEWYLLAPEERRDMLIEHGVMGRDFPDVRANTVSAFALNDYEWLLAFEADELTRIVDLMRHLRGAAARRHTREELPFITGIRQPLADCAAALP